MESGIRPSNEIIDVFNTLKINPKIRCMILDINSKEELVILEQFDRNFLYKDLLDTKYLPANDSRYILYFPYVY